jgi:putative toxin-antitoxin system antitoxin component (TIGR02293 family)
MAYNYQHEVSMVNEATALYLSSVNPAGVSGYGSFKAFLQNKLLMIQSIRNGLTIAFFEAIAERMPFTEREWSDILNISQKSLQRYRAESSYVFKPIHSEKILQIAEVIEFGREVFDTDEHLYLWLDTPSFALGNVKPALLLRDAYGKELVMDELNRIEHGIFA